MTLPRQSSKMQPFLQGQGNMSILFHLLIGCLLATLCHGNQYDPHVYPSEGPFFEGWYVRLMDGSQGFSLGFLFGRVLPAPSSSPDGGVLDTENMNQNCEQSSSRCVHDGQQNLPLVYASVLVQDNNVSQKLQSHNGAFPVKDYSILVNGKPVVRNPDDESPPNFSARLGQNGTFSVSKDETYIDVAIGNTHVFIRSSNPVPWGQHGLGPEGHLEILPLPLHWFVYSLRSMVTHYKFTDLVSGRSVSGKNARLHMEKNWGKTFPTAWVWSQGLTENNVSLALAGGIVSFSVLDVTAFLVGYRNPARKIVWNFTPANSVPSFVHDGCNGTINLNLTSLDCRLALTISSPVSSFSDCLLGPEKYGFRPVCVESYNAVASVRAYQRHDFHFVEIDRAEIPETSLELGGKYVCKEKCTR